MPRTASQSFKVLSIEPEAANYPSGVIATVRTRSVCPLSVCRNVLVVRSHTFRLLSLEAEITICPFDEIVTAVT